MLIFQYGSNTSAARLNSPDRLRGDARDLGLVRTVETFELSFDVWSERNQCAASDIREGGDSPAWGVLYEIPDDLVTRGGRAGRKSLDQIEGSKYLRRSIPVVFHDGSEPDDPVYTYVVQNPAEGLETSIDYVTHIITGLSEHNAPADYIDKIKTIAIANNPRLKPMLSRQPCT